MKRWLALVALSGCFASTRPIQDGNALALCAGDWVLHESSGATETLRVSFMGADHEVVVERGGALQKIAVMDYHAHGLFAWDRAECILSASFEDGAVFDITMESSDDFESVSFSGTPAVSTGEFYPR